MKQQQQEGRQVHTNAENGDKTVTTRSVWTSHPHVFQAQYLRPCHVLNREHVPDDTGTATRMVYTVKLLNRNTSMLFPQENIPAGERHFVSGVPRHAIYFTDLPYSTDQHLTYAFRHWIGGMDDLYPQAWMDLH